MALPTLDATFASSVDLPRRQMLARWLVEELGETQAPSNLFVSGAGSSGVNGPYIDAGVFGGKRFYNLQSGGYVIAWDSPNWVIRNIASITLYTSNNNVEFPWQVTTWSVASGSAPVPTVSESPSPSPISNYYDLPERYLWAKIAVAAGGPKTEADYISLPKNYAWSDIYNAVVGSSGNHTDWSEKQALGHIAAAYRGDTGTPANLATYIDWPWRYQVAAIIDGVGPAFPSEGLLAFWKLSDLTDASGNGNNLVNTNGVQFVAGKIGNCAQFDGTDKSLNLSSFSSPFSSASPYTISLWYNVTTLKDYFSLVGCIDTETLNIHGDENGRLDINNSAAEDIFVENFFTAGSWNHLVVTRNSSNQIAVWSNGVKIQEDTSTGTYGNVPYINIGALEEGDTMFAMDGKIDAVGMWQRTLTQSEIESLYNSGNGIEKV